MTNNKPTKFYSSIQESQIADYLGWKVVTGSGARDCYPGDIQSDKFLGECKTHMKVTDKIIFYMDHWKKISDEASSRFKFPVLFVDDGSQLIDNTWLLTLDCAFNRRDVTRYNFPYDRKTNIIMPSNEMKAVIDTLTDSNKSPVIFVIDVDGRNLAITDLPTFAKVFER